MILDRISKPIFVLGAAHSGTTILYRMLAMHPDITWFSQFSQRSGAIPGRLRLPFYRQIDRISRALFPFDWRKREGRIGRLFVSRPGEANTIWEYIFPDTEDISPRISISRMYKIFENECRIWGKSYLIVKLPRLYKYIDVLFEAYPTGKFIHIVRDGRAVALSDRHKFMRHGETPLEGLQAAAQYWVDVVSKIAPKKSAVPLYEIRYEDLCSDVHAHLKDIMQWIGLNEHKFPFHRVPQFLKPTNNIWYRRMTAEEKAMLHRLQQVYLKRYGYLA